jgi:predicted ATPase
MLKSFSFRNFKSYDDAVLPLAELTVLLGANASGKSNALEAAQLLTWLAEGRRLDALLVALQQGDIQVRGAPTDLNREGERIVLGCMLVDPQGRDLELRIELIVSADGMRIAGEKLTRADEKLALYELVASGSAFTNQIAVSYNNFSRGRNKPQIPAVDQQAVFTQLTTPARFDASHSKAQSEIPAAASFVQRTLESVLFLDPSPLLMREYSFKPDHKKLRGDGSNVSAVLSFICEDKLRQADILGFVRSLPEQNITGISFLDGPLGEVMVQLRETFGGRDREVPARLLSDGTLRVLAIASALLSVAEETLVVIEEIDNGVHPPRARALLEHITAIAKKRRLRVLLTTHNPALLDAIPNASVPNVVACYRDPETGASRLIRLADLERYPELVAQGPLGQIVTQGVLDRILKEPAPTSEARQGSLEALLKSLSQT